MGAAHYAGSETIYSVVSQQGCWSFHSFHYRLETILQVMWTFKTVTIPKPF